MSIRVLNNDLMLYSAILLGLVVIVGTTSNVSLEQFKSKRKKDKVFTSVKYDEVMVQNLVDVLSKDRTEKLITSFDDGFLNRLDNNYINLEARGVGFLSEYVDVIANVGEDAEDDEKLIIYDALMYILKYVQDNGFKYNSYINVDKFINMDFKVSIVNDKEIYENSLPHTRFSELELGVVILPFNVIERSSSFVRTLFHELIHLYQKTYMDDWYSYLDYEGWRIQNVNADMYDNTRVNPDADARVWLDKNGKKYGCTFQRSKHGFNLETITCRPKNNIRFEHPAERYAYMESDKFQV